MSNSSCPIVKKTYKKRSSITGVQVVPIKGCSLFHGEVMGEKCKYKEGSIRYSSLNPMGLAQSTPVLMGLKYIQCTNNQGE